MKQTEHKVHNFNAFTAVHRNIKLTTVPSKYVPTHCAYFNTISRIYMMLVTSCVVIARVLDK